MKKRRIAILGSTGSIGAQALDVIARHNDLFEVEVLTANQNFKLLIEQAIKFQPNVVVIAADEHYLFVKDALRDYPTKVYGGAEAVAQVASMDTIDIVLTAMVGFSGLIPTIEAIKAEKVIALANKETLVVAGQLITDLLGRHKSFLIPVDSEHSAIFQCLAGERLTAVEKIILTASGGPFHGKPTDVIKSAKKEDALKHPTWNMGNKITIDSASLMNKGLEAIEAKWLFNLTPNQIDVVVHPQSIIHSFVQFVDGSMKAQMSLPDMRLPILYALNFPDRVLSDFPRFRFFDYPELTFTSPDTRNFPNLELAFEAMKRGGNVPCILNAANEIAVEAFLNDRVSFHGMSDLIQKAIDGIGFVASPQLSDYVETDSETRKFVKSLII
jgi:1-deoxy-D-xylulose-5-phosphate reductoisomerase